MRVIRNIPDPKRFVRVKSSKSKGTSKIKNRDEGMPRKNCVGDLLSCLWALYGPPDSVMEEGFDYTFKDTVSGLIFTAYCAGSGPAFGGRPEDEARLLPVLDLFNDLLEKTKPADCEIEYYTDFGTYRSGARNGKPYDKRISKRTLLDEYSE